MFYTRFWIRLCILLSLFKTYLTEIFPQWKKLSQINNEEDTKIVSVGIVIVSLLLTLNWYLPSSQQTFTCSVSTIETLQKGFKYYFLRLRLLLLFTVPVPFLNSPSHNYYFRHCIFSCLLNNGIKWRGEYFINPFVLFHSAILCLYMILFQKLLRPAILLKKETLARCIPVNFAKLLRTPIL